MGYVVNGMKPIAAGANFNADQLSNEDALLIQQQSSTKLEYSMVNPVLFEEPIAPHIAAIESDEEIDIDKLVNTYSDLKSLSDLLLVEGVGGWRVPLGHEQSIYNLVKALDLPVILVVGLRLGCINHAILTAETILKDGLCLSGWMLSEIDKEYLYKQRTIDTLISALNCPYLAEIPHRADSSIQHASLNRQDSFQDLFKSK